MYILPHAHISSNYSILLHRKGSSVTKCRHSLPKLMDVIMLIIIVTKLLLHHADSTWYVHARMSINHVALRLMS